MPLRQSRERFRMDPRLREDDKQKTKETSKQENVWDGVEYFCLQKAATRQTRTVLKFVSIIEPHRPLPSFSRTRESIYPRAPSSALGKVLTVANIYKHRATPSIVVILANVGIHLSARTEQCVGESAYSGKHSKCRESKVNAVIPSTRNARFWDYTRITSKRRKRQAGKPFRTRKSLVRRPHIANIWPTPVGECNVMKHPVKA